MQCSAAAQRLQVTTAPKDPGCRLLRLQQSQCLDHSLSAAGGTVIMKKIFCTGLSNGFKKRGGGRENQHRIWKISQSAHLTLQQTSENEDHGGIKMTKLDLFTVGKLHTVSLCKKSAHNSVFYSMGKKKCIYTYDSPSVMILIHWYFIIRGYLGAKRWVRCPSQGFLLSHFLFPYSLIRTLEGLNDLRDLFKISRKYNTRVSK